MEEFITPQTPPEIWLAILEYCDNNTLLTMAITSKYLRHIVTEFRYPDWRVQLTLKEQWLRKREKIKKEIQKGGFKNMLWNYNEIKDCMKPHYFDQDKIFLMKYKTSGYHPIIYYQTDDCEFTRFERSKK